MQTTTTTISPTQRTVLGVALALGAATLWGTTGTSQALAGAAGGGLDAAWFGTLRLVAAAAFFALCAGLLTMRGDGAAALVSGGRLRWGDAVGAGLCMAAYNLAFFAGVRSTGVALGTAVALGSGPVWAGMLQALVQRQMPRAGWWAGMLVAVAGGALLVLGAQDARGAQAGGLHLGGLALCLVAGLSYAVYTLLNKRMAQAGVPALRITLAAFSLAALLAVPLAWANSGLPTPRGNDLLAVAYTGVVTAGVAYLLFSVALRHIGPATGVTLALAEPLVAFALAVAVLGERPTWVAGVGVLLLVGGVLLVVRQELRGS